MREDGGDFRRGGAKGGKKWIWDWMSGDWEDGKGADISAVCGLAEICASSIF